MTAPPDVRDARDARQAAIRRERRAGRELAALARSIPVVLPGWVNPLDPGYRVTARFGASGALWSKTHTGVDLAIATGTPVKSAGNGTVTFAGDDGAYGLKVEVTHPDGTLIWYAHMSRIDVTEGEAVAAGDPLGAVGATGNVTGPHLHLEVRPLGDEPVDPVTALGAHGVDLM